MLKANSENHTMIGSPVALWFPGRKMEGGLQAAAAAPAHPLSERAREIAKSRDELLGLLRGLPESEYELSLTDLVEKGSVLNVGNNSAVGCNKTTSPEGESKRSASTAVKERKKKRRSSSSSSDGVLLNFYVPASLSRSLTASRPSRPGLARSRRDADCVDKRDREPTFGCWSALWERGRGKSRRQLFERR